MTVTQPQSEERLTGGDLNAALARSIVQLFRHKLGRGPTKARAFYRDNFVIVVYEDALTHAERVVRDEGHPRTVQDLRSEIQESLESPLRDIVERLTGRRVIALLSATSIEPDMGSEVFVLDAPVA